MIYSQEITINLPRNRVIELFDNPDNMAKWQEGFQSFEHLEGEAGKPGARSKLVYLMGKRRVEMIETITRRDLPDHFDGTYEAKGVWNLVKNTFEDQGDKTHWKVETEFKMKGFMSIMAFLMPGMFKKTTRKYMQSFKNFAEQEA